MHKETPGPAKGHPRELPGGIEKRVELHTILCRQLV